MKLMTSQVSLSILSLAILFGCGQGKKQSEEASAEEMKSSVTITKAPASPKFPEAQLTKNDVIVTDQDSTYAVDYSFDVANYELGVQTSDADTRGIANSGKGQHIHFIVNNGPYSAHYMPGVSNTLDEGNYVVLAFLSRSYHESVKSLGAYYVENLTVGDVEESPVDLDAPHLFFSRPKGTYKGADTEKLMLDFYLLNTDLSADGNKVKATINGEEFMIEEWAPYYIEGLDKGEVSIKLELIDADGNAVPGPFNVVERKVMLEE
ncbi:MAG: phosphopeptide-binding protein [Cyclobacteriaceae bacterium]